jgi:hypothetical protein
MLKQYSENTIGLIKIGPRDPMCDPDNLLSRLDSFPDRCIYVDF